MRREVSDIDFPYGCAECAFCNGAGIEAWNRPDGEVEHEMCRECDGSGIFVYWPGVEAFVPRLPPKPEE